MPKTRSSGESSSLSNEVAGAIAASPMTTKTTKKCKAKSSDNNAGRKKSLIEKTASSNQESEDVQSDGSAVPEPRGSLGSPLATNQDGGLVRKQKTRTPVNLQVNQDNVTDGNHCPEIVLQEVDNTATPSVAPVVMDQGQIDMMITRGMPALLKAVREDPEMRKLFTEGLKTGEDSTPQSASTQINSRVVVVQGGKAVDASARRSGMEVDHLDKQSQGVMSNESAPASYDSEVTLYERCLEKESEQQIPAVDEFNGVEEASNVLNSSDETDRQLILNRFVGNVNSEETVGFDIADTQQRSVVDAGRQQSACERDRRDPNQQDRRARERSRERATDAVRQAENAQVKLLHPPGELNQSTDIAEQVDKQLSQLRLRVAPNTGPKARRSVTFASQIATAGGSTVSGQSLSDDDSDDDYHIYAHVDPKLVLAIQQGEYIELNKLAPHGCVDLDNEGKLQLVNSGGKIGVVSGDRAPPQITNYQQWQVAFRVFSAIYQKAYPEKGIELLEYEHNIHNAARHYVWHNVAVYDNLFRKRIARHHNKKTQKSWGDKYSRAWDFELQEKLGRPFNVYQKPVTQTNVLPTPGASPGTKKEICLHFNKTGKCRYGAKCHRDHRCLHCGQKGHGMVNCYKLKGKDEHKK